MRTRRLFRLLFALSALSALGVGCQWIIDGELGTIGCDNEGALGPPVCPTHYACQQGQCVARVNTTLGQACVTDADCASGDFCLDPLLFGDQGEPFCTRSCCSSRDCDPDQSHVCWNPAKGGGSFCRRFDIVGREGSGSGQSGDACDLGQQCRSGLCHEGVCTDACCSDTNCPSANERCQVTKGVLSSGAAWACQPEQKDKKGYLDTCVNDSECDTGLCVQFGTESRCSMSCCSSTGCSGFVEMPTQGGVESFAIRCVDVEREGALLRACAAPSPVGALAAVGSACTMGETCRGGECLLADSDLQGVCSDVCCTEASCGDLALYQCRPYPVGTSWALRCEPK